MRSRVLLVVAVVTVVFASVFAAIAIEPHSADAYPVPPVMPRNHLPATTAGSWVYVQYEHDFSVQAYECGEGVVVSGFLGDRYQTVPCTDWRLVVYAHSIRARLWHAMDYYTHFYMNVLDWQYFNAILRLYTAYAKQAALYGRVAYWATEQASCGALTGMVAAAKGGWAAGLAAGGCHAAFDRLNPYGQL